MNTLGQRIVFAREKKGLKQNELAKRLGITPTRLNYYEKDKREPDVMMLKKIAYALNVDPNYLLGDWDSSCYEDYSRAKTDEERLYILNHAGTPYNLSSEHRRLLRKFADPTQIDSDNQLIHEEIARRYGPYAVDLLIAYRSATPEERTVIDDIVRRYPRDISEKSPSELASDIELEKEASEDEAEAREMARLAYEQYLSEKRPASPASSANTSAGKLA